MLPGEADLGQDRPELGVLRVEIGGEFAASHVMADAADARLRLMELAEAKEEWKIVADHAVQAQAINPLIAAPHRHLGRAAEALGDRPAAIAAYRALLLRAATPSFA